MGIERIQLPTDYIAPKNHRTYSEGLQRVPLGHWPSLIRRKAFTTEAEEDLVIAKIGNLVIEELTNQDFSITRLPILAITKSSSASVVKAFCRCSRLHA